jgi:tRNA A-37 threonylcarbamoyl transferase component Bud32
VIKKATPQNAVVLAVRRNAPWWIWVVAASFVLSFLLVIYFDFEGPVLGIFSASRAGRLVVTVVAPRSPGDVAGLRAGDGIVRADGRLIHSYIEWIQFLFDVRVGKPIRFEVDRASETLSLTATPERKSFVGYDSSSLNRALLRIGQAFTLGLACFLAFAKPRNSAALMAALILAALSLINNPQNLIGGGPILRGLPTIAIALLWLVAVSEAVVAPILFTFCATFPISLIRARWIWALVWTPPVLWLVPRLSLAYQMMYYPSQPSIFPDWVHVGLNSLSAGYFVGGPIAMALNYRRLTDTNERRRIQILMIGAAFGFLALAPSILLAANPALTATWLGRFFNSPPNLLARIVLTCLVFPLSFVYSILRHRLFDVRIIIRQGIQYAMARGVLLSIMPLLIVGLLTDVAFHGDQPLAVILRSRGWIYGVLGTLAAIVYQKRQAWLDRLDRVFFRDRYDAKRVLQELVQSLKQAENLFAASSEVVNRIENALHSEFVSLLHRAADQTEFRAIASEPAHHTKMRLRKDAKLMALVRLVEKPLQFLDSNWLTEKLPREEIRLIEQEGIDLIVPIKIGSDAAESLLVLGPKRSEEPYSREDERLLNAIAASLALLSRAAVPERQEMEGFRECPSCGACFSLLESNCDQDGSTLVRIDMSRLLAGRYRIERRIGRGGMGTVYAGVDQMLERAIAVKMIRTELVEHRQITAKFHQEARSAAGLVHRNVITIYDFGVERQHPFIIMELLAGRTLRTELDRTKPLSPKRTIEILDGVCAAIEEAHRRKLLHRDLKPENIFIAQTPTGEVVKVLDFGLVKALATSIRSDAPTRAASSVIAGTPYYMAPEQMMGETATEATDVWALGVITYEMLIGAHPFVTGSVASWQKAMFKGCFTPVRSHRQDASQNWQAFFERVFQPEPKHRVGSARIFFAELVLALKSPDQKTKANSLSSEQSSSQF